MASQKYIPNKAAMSNRQGQVGGKARDSRGNPSNPRQTGEEPDSRNQGYAIRTDKMSASCTCSNPLSWSMRQRRQQQEVDSRGERKEGI